MRPANAISSRPPSRWRRSDSNRPTALIVTGDFGVTFGDPDGKDTVLRSYWNNQATGLVADEVFELQLEPKNWGRLTFE